MGIQQAVYGTPRADLGAAIMEYVDNKENLITTKVLPIFGVEKKAATISVITRESLLKYAGDGMHKSGTAYARLEIYAEDKTFACKERAFEGALPADKAEEYAGDFNTDFVVAKHPALKMFIAQERAAAAKIFNVTTWAGAELFTDNKANPWSTAATDIIGQVLAAKEKVRKNTGMNPNALIVGAETLANMLKNTGIKAQFPGSSIVTLALIEGALPAIFGLSKLIVGGQVYDSALEGQTFVGVDVWAKTYAMVALVAEDEGDLTQPCVGRTLLWTTDTPDIATVDEYEEVQTRNKIFRCRQFTDENIFDAYFGHLMQIEV